jgi:S-adenosyl methyltransferase
MAVPGTSGPNPARIDNYWAGGSDWHDTDRDLAERMTDPREGYPGLRRLVRENHAFTGRAVTWAASRGISRFLVLGCGLPVPPAVHETARAQQPGASAVYVDGDLLVVSHAGRMAGPGVAVIAGDVRDPAAVLADPAVRELADGSGPVCVLLTAVVHRMGPQEVREIIAGFTGPLPAGSVLVLTTSRYEDEALHARLSGMFPATAAPRRNHSREDVAGFFDGLDLVHGQVMDVRCWPFLPPDPERAVMMLGGVGVKS